MASTQPVREIPLYSHYNDKDQLRKFNDIYWNSDKKIWTVKTDNPKLDEILEQWSPCKLKVPYNGENIDLMRKLNGMFDKTEKTWLVSSRYKYQIPEYEDWLVA